MDPSSSYPIRERLGVGPEQLAGLCRRHNLVELSVFGSVVRDFRGDSDVDVLVRYRPGHVPRLCELLDLRAELEAIFRRSVDLVTSGVIDSAPDDRFSRSVMQSRRVLYAA